MALVDEAARRQALTQLDRTLLVEAGAGTGKTELMAGRVLMLFANGVPADAIAVITFTELAASELLQRIQAHAQSALGGELPVSLASVLPEGLTERQRAALESAVDNIDQLHCSTIHGFCQALIRPYPVEADQDPGASVADEGGATLAFDTLLEDWLHERLDRDDGEDGIVASMFTSDPASAQQTIEALALFMRRNRTARPASGTLARKHAEAFAGAVGAFESWHGESCGEETTASSLNELNELAGFYLEQLNEPLAFSKVLAASSPPRKSLMLANKLAFRKYQAKGKWRNAAKADGQSQAEGDRLNDEAASHYARCSQVHEELLGRIASWLVEALCREVEEPLRRYAEHKRDAAQLDFDDLLHVARDLLASNESVRRALGARYRHILVDEFQDTDPLQAEILFYLAGDDAASGEWLKRPLRPGQLFLVGDPKQAIYRFRGGDVQTYVTARDALAAQQPDSLVAINANFRSGPGIIDYVNDRFAPVLSGEGQPGFHPLSATVPAAPGGGPAVAALEVEVEAAGDKPNAGELRNAEAERVAQICEAIIGTLEVRGEGGAMRPCAPSDIALLAPTGTELWIYERALEQRQLPIATQAGKGLFRRQEVHDLIALSRVLADGRDTLALAALLRGPLVGLSEERLLDLALCVTKANKDARPRLSLWIDVDHVDDEVAAQTLSTLQSLARRSRTTTPAHLLAQAVEALRVRAIVAQRHSRTSERALANVDHFLELAGPYAVRGLAHFARDMTAAWQDNERAAEGRPDAAAEAIQVLTIHSAKGLEWPVVIPINAATGAQGPHAVLRRRSDDTLHTRFGALAPPEWEAAKEHEAKELARERQRLWYVALTRARDRLLLPRPDPAPAGGWISDVDLGLDDLEVFAVPAETGGRFSSGEYAANEQTREVFAGEARRIVESTRIIQWRRPSLHEDEDERPAPAPESELAGAGEPPNVQGSAKRGLVLHKLMEEVINGEVADSAEDLTARAEELTRQLGEIPADDAATGLAPAELAGTVTRTLALPAVAAVRERLVVEMPVYGSEARANGEIVAVAGIADALALDAAGAVELVIDWKSDVEPAARERERHRAQLEDYLTLTGARKGLVVYMSLGVCEHANASRTVQRSHESP